MLKSISTVAVATAFLAAAPIAAQALPAASLGGANDAAIVRVSGGCGLAFHRGPLGGCRPNVVIVRPVVCRIVGLIPHRVCTR